jgi:hypothetical protein
MKRQHSLLTKEQIQAEREEKLRSKKTVYDTTRLALVYSRQSTKDQPVHNKEAALMQSDDLVAYAVQYGWAEERIVLFIENELDKWGRKLAKPRAASGRLDINLRPGLREVERLIEEDKAGAVFVRDVSRLFRDADMVSPPQFARTCKQHHVVILTYDQEFDFNATSRDDLKDFLEEAQDAADFLKFQRRTLHRARERKGMRGEFAGHAIPTGFMLDDKRRAYVPNPLWAPVVAELTRRFCELDADLGALHNEIRGRAIFPVLPDDIRARIGRIQLRPVPGGFTIAGRASLRELLINPANVGHKVFQQRVVKLDAHPGIVEQADYAYALAHLGKVDLQGNVINRPRRTPRYTRGQRREGLLAGVRPDGRPVVTSSQGSVYVFQQAGYVTYIIKDNRELGKNPYSGSIALDVVDRAVSERLETILQMLSAHAEVETFLDGSPTLGARAMIEHVAALRRQVSGSLGKLDTTCAEIEKAISWKQREYEVARDLMSDTDIRNHFAALAQLRGRLDDLRDKQAQAAQVEQDALTVTSRLARAKDHWQTMTLEQRRSFIRLITQAVTLDALSDRWMKLGIVWSPVLAGEDAGDCVLFLRATGAGSNWTAEEDALLRELYPRAPRSDLLTALARRSWESCKSRARVLKVMRQTRDAGSFQLMETLALNDLAVIEAYGIAEQEIAAGVTVFWRKESAVRQEGAR